MADTAKTHAVHRGVVFKLQNGTYYCTSCRVGTFFLASNGEKVDDDPHASNCVYVHTRSFEGKHAVKGTTFKGGELFFVDGFTFCLISTEQRNPSEIQVRCTKSSSGCNCQLWVTFSLWTFFFLFWFSALAGPKGTAGTKCVQARRNYGGTI